MKWCRHIDWGLGLAILLDPALALSQTPPPVEKELPRTSAPQARELLYGLPLAPHELNPDGLVSGFIDSGVDREHPQIGNVITYFKDFSGEGEGDYFGHGTIVVLLFLKGHYQAKESLKEFGSSTGVGPLAMARVSGRRPASADEMVGRTVDAIQWLEEKNSATVNISLGLMEGLADYTPLCDAIAGAEDILFLVSAGNFGPKIASYPAACPASNIISFGLLGLDGQVEEYSGAADFVVDNSDIKFTDMDHYQIETADQLVRDGEFEQAGIHYKDVLTRSGPKQLRGRAAYGLGFIATQSGDFGGAAAYFEDAIAADGDHIDAQDALAKLYHRCDAPEKGLVLVRQALAQDTEHPRLLRTEASLLLELTRLKEAQEVLERLDELDQPAQDLLFTVRNLQNLERAIDSNSTDPVDMLSIAAEYGDVSIIEFLAHRYSVDPEAIANGRAVVPATLAAFNGHFPAVLALVDAGADINGTDPTHKISPLMAAALKNNGALVERLLDIGADVAATDDFGFTALMFAAEGGHEAPVNALLAAGSPLDQKSDDGLSAEDYARRGDYHSILEQIVLEKSRRKEEGGQRNVSTAVILDPCAWLSRDE